MSLVTVVLLLAATSITLTRSQDPEISATSLDGTQPPIKLDKNLRRALLKALTDLEVESAEQHKDESETIAQRDTSAFEGVAKKNLNSDLGVQKAIFSFKSFPSDDDLPGEDKLQNSSFIEAVRYVTLKTPAMNIEKATQEDARSFHVQNVILPERNSGNFGAKTESKTEQTEKTVAHGPVNTFQRFSVSKVQSVTLKPATESLTESATNGIASADTIVGQNPSASASNNIASTGIAASGNPISGTTSNGIPTSGIASNGIPSNPIATANAVVVQKSKTEDIPAISSISNNVTITESNDSKDKTEEVKIFQAPLVAAFTVQQDEQGVPKSVVPIFRSPNDAQALTLQEQLEFKQQLLEKQLVELQQQQIQQTQFLVRQQQLYEQQLRQKQQQQFYLQEQARIKQLEEQAKLKMLEEQRIKQLEEQRFKFEEQRLNRFQRPVPQKQFFFEQNSNFLNFQPPVDSNVHLQPSLALEVPNVATPPAFQPFQQDLRFRSQPTQHHHQQQQQVQSLQHVQQSQQLQPLQQAQQLQQVQHLQQAQQAQQLHQSQQQPQQHQQRLQQSFASFSSDFQPSTTRFNRQEAFSAIGNFGFNQNPAENTNVAPSRSNFGFNAQQQRTPANFYNPFVASQYRQQTKPPTPAKQIQHLLYQSGIAGNLNNVPGIGNQEDLNIVSKVLALNVGAVPNKNTQFGLGSGLTTTFGKSSA